MTDGAARDASGRRDPARLKQWQAAHGLPPTGRMRASTVRAARAAARRGESAQPMWRAAPSGGATMPGELAGRLLHWQHLAHALAELAGHLEVEAAGLARLVARFAARLGELARGFGPGAAQLLAELAELVGEARGAVALIRSAGRAAPLAARVLTSWRAAAASPALRRLPRALAAASGVVDGVQGYARSGAHTSAGRIAEGVADGLGTFAINSGPFALAAASLLPSRFSPTTAVHGLAAAGVAGAEWLTTGDRGAMDTFEARAHAGEHGLFVQQADAIIHRLGDELAPLFGDQLDD